MNVKLVSVDSIRKWPRLLGRKCELKYQEIGKPALLLFDDGALRTSNLKRVVTVGNEIHLHTKNGIYKLEKLKGE